MIAAGYRIRLLFCLYAYIFDKTEMHAAEAAKVKNLN